MDTVNSATTINYPKFTPENIEMILGNLVPPEIQNIGRLKVMELRFMTYIKNQIKNKEPFLETSHIFDKKIWKNLFDKNFPSLHFKTLKGSPVRGPKGCIKHCRYLISLNEYYNIIVNMISIRKENKTLVYVVKYKFINKEKILSTWTVKPIKKLMRTVTTEENIALETLVNLSKVRN